MSGTRAISTTWIREMSSNFFFLQGKVPKEIHAILTETLASFLPGRAEDLSAPLYRQKYMKFYSISLVNKIPFPFISFSRYFLTVRVI